MSTGTPVEVLVCVLKRLCGKGLHGGSCNADGNSDNGGVGGGDLHVHQQHDAPAARERGGKGRVILVCENGLLMFQGLGLKKQIFRRGEAAERQTHCANCKP